MEEEPYLPEINNRHASKLDEWGWLEHGEYRLSLLLSTIPVSLTVLVSLRSTGGSIRGGPIRISFRIFLSNPFARTRRSRSWNLSSSVNLIDDSLLNFHRDLCDECGCYIFFLFHRSKFGFYLSR